MTLAFQGAGKIAGIAGAMYGFIQILGSSLSSKRIVKAKTTCYNVIKIDKVTGYYIK